MHDILQTPASPLPCLDFVARGGQSRVFGTKDWVVKVPRLSWQAALGRVLVHPREPVAAMESLGGLLEPFLLVENISFRASGSLKEAGAGRKPAAPARWHHARWAVAGPRQNEEDFLHRRIAHTTPGEAARLIGQMLATMDAIKARGWHLLDFIMSNFAVAGQGRVRLVDAGLLIPNGHLRWPSHQVCSRSFMRRMIPDYLEVLEKVCARHPSDREGAAALREVMADFPRRIKAWRRGDVCVAEELSRPSRAIFPAALREEIIATLRGKLPLTPRTARAYTGGHHAFAPEN